MKCFYVLFFLIFTYSSYSQNVNFDIYNDFKNSISKEKLLAARTVEDLISDYPKNWLQDLISIDISISNLGNQKYVSSNEKLNSSQLLALSKTQTWSEIKINILYHKKNSVTEYLDINMMDFKVSVLPSNQAKFEGGMLALKKILKDKINDTILKNALLKIQGNGLFYFTVNGNGKITDVCMETSTQDTETDILIFKSLQELPDWEAANNNNETPVKQRFKFILYGPGGC